MNQPTVKVPLIHTETVLFIHNGTGWKPLCPPGQSWPEKLFASAPSIDEIQQMIHEEFKNVSTPLLIITRQTK